MADPVSTHPATSYTAILFDCDGVLVNSEAIVDRIYRKHLDRIGLSYSQTEFGERLMGLTREASARLLAEDANKLGVAAPDANFYTQVRAAMLQAFDQELIAVAGAHRLISRWPGTQAVASSSVAATLRLKLEMTGLAELFGEHIYSADVVAQGKPDPAIFLYAAKQLGVPPNQCLAIEDSVNGVVSAKRAGMTVLGFTGGGHCLAGHDQVLLQAGANQVFASHADIAQYLNLNK